MSSNPYPCSALHKEIFNLCSFTSLLNLFTIKNVKLTETLNCITDAIKSGPASPASGISRRNDRLS